MKQHGKKYRAAAEKIEAGRKYDLDGGVAKVKEISFAKFDETVELTVWLGVDPRKADQLVRATIVLPHGLGKSKSQATRLARMSMPLTAHNLRAFSTTSE